LVLGNAQVEPADSRLELSPYIDVLVLGRCGCIVCQRLVLPVDEAASCPASCIFPPSPGCVSELPLPRSLSPEPASESSGCPLVSVLRLCRRWMFELPRTSHAFGGAGFSQVPSRPVACLPPAAPLM